MLTVPDDVCEFVPIIETVLNNWSGLKLCIDNGMGGDPLQVTRKLQKMIDNIHTALSQDDFYDLVDLLEDTLDAEFDTELQDESAPEVATVLFELYKGWHEGRKEEVLDQVRKNLTFLFSKPSSGIVEIWAILLIFFLQDTTYCMKISPSFS